LAIAIGRKVGGAIVEAGQNVVQVEQFGAMLLAWARWGLIVTARGGGVDDLDHASGQSTSFPTVGQKKAMTS
jgi:hypothetical protein